MLIDIGLASILMLIFYLVGKGLNAIFLKKNFKNIEILFLIGYVTSICFAMWYGIFDKSIIVYIYTFMILVGLISFIKNKNYKIEITPKNQIKSTSIVMLSGSLVASLQNPSLFGNFVVSRIGPDFYGWSIASHFFAGKENLKHFKDRLLNELGVNNFSQVFDIASHPETVIYRALSYNDQIAAEFIVGAQRIGIPSLVGTLNEYSSIGIIRLMHALVISSFLITTIFLLRMLNKTSFTTSLIVVLIYLFNINVISILNEGGVGQTLSTPIITFLLLANLKPQKSFEEKKTALILFGIFSISTYSDLIIIFALYILLYHTLLISLRKISFIESIRRLKRYLIPLAIVIFITLPNLSSVFKIVLERINGGVSAGWDQGRTPLFSDFLGLHNWLSPDGVTSSSRGFGEITISILLTITLIILLIKTREVETKAHGLTIFLIYLGFLYLVYGQNQERINNYMLWKLSGFASMAIVLVYISHFKNMNNEIHFKTLKIRILHVGFIILSATSFFSWISDFKGSSYEIELKNNSKMANILISYDVDISYWPNTSGLQFLLIGNVNHGGEQRRVPGFSVPRSEPYKPLVFIIPRTSCSDSRCVNRVYPKINERSQEILKNQKFEVWKTDESS